MGACLKEAGASKSPCLRVSLSGIPLSFDGQLIRKIMALNEPTAICQLGALSQRTPPALLNVSRWRYGGALAGLAPEAILGRSRQGGRLGTWLKTGSSLGAEAMACLFDESPVSSSLQIYAVVQNVL
ncbi:hypothetical protein O181_033120 [Austropuccinia psidii MF-1]|uniref:Uncharacterized protein n=1 Tax=Austropuccinia psidii MF-1 TaxID=1389203 RepID=A0A9Q3H8W9_9BASI|nr:hypothetical protein [Austropuccinia psidii MF-1]